MGNANLCPEGTGLETKYKNFILENMHLMS